MIASDDKTCAFFRRSWWQTAKAHLSDTERLALYETVFAYSFEDTPAAVDLPPMAALLFDLIRPVLAADRQKMQHKADIARQNGMTGGRPKVVRINEELSKPSGLNENPAGFYGLAIYNTTNPNTTANGKNIPCVSKSNSAEDFSDTHTKFLVSTEFFLMGVADPVEEAKLFWAYYEAREWITGDGQKVRNIVALSKSWHPKSLTMALAKKRAAFRSLLEKLENSDFSLFERLLAADIDNSTKTVFLFVRTKEDAVYLEERYINPLSLWVKDKKARGDDWRLEYRFSAAG